MKLDDDLNRIMEKSVNQEKRFAKKYLPKDRAIEMDSDDESDESFEESTEENSHESSSSSVEEKSSENLPRIIIEPPNYEPTLKDANDSELSIYDYLTKIPQKIIRKDFHSTPKKAKNARKDKKFAEQRVYSPASIEKSNFVHPQFHSTMNEPLRNDASKSKKNKNIEKQNNYAELLNPIRILEMPIKIPTSAMSPVMNTKYKILQKIGENPKILSIVFDFDEPIMHHGNFIHNLCVENILD